MKKKMKKLILFLIIALIFFLIYSYKFEILKLANNINIKLVDNFEENVNIIINGTLDNTSKKEVYTDEEIEEILESTDVPIEGDYVGKIDNYYYNQLDKYAKVIYKTILDNTDKLKQKDYNIQIPNVLSNIMRETDGKEKLNITFQNTWNALRLDHPELFYINVEDIYLTTKTTTLGKKVTYEFYLNNKKGTSTTNNLTNDYESQIEEKKTEIIANANKYNNNLTKILYIHNWIVDNADYDISFQEEDNNNIYGVLIKKSAICEGYAKTFKYLLDELNIPCIMICGSAVSDDGSSETHAWNAVYIDSKWYAIDVTWDDPVIMGNGTLTNDIKYRYFLKGSNEMEKNHNQNGRLSDNKNEIEFKYPELSINNYQYTK